MKRKLSYSKKGNDKPLYKLLKKSSQEMVRISASPSFLERSQIPSTYQKFEGNLSPVLFCVISGGTQRERKFLYELEKKNTFSKIAVVFISSGNHEGGLTPLMMQTKYKEIIKKGEIKQKDRTIKIADIDKFYMLTDVDHYSKELKKLIQNKVNNGPKWIISNPDFEIRLYYCFRNSPYEDLKEIYNAQPSKRSSLLKTINGRFNEGGGLDTRKAFENIKNGIRNSKQHYKDTDGFPMLLSTQMHYFAEDVLKYCEEEYDKWIKEKNIFRKELSNKNRTYRAIE